MDFIVPISEARGKLPEYIKKIRSMGKHMIITKNGRPEAVLVTPEELETLEIRSDKDLMRSLVRAQEDLSAGRLHSHRDVFRNV